MSRLSCLWLASAVEMIRQQQLFYQMSQPPSSWFSCWRKLPRSRNPAWPASPSAWQTSCSWTCSSWRSWSRHSAPSPTCQLSFVLDWTWNWCHTCGYQQPEIREKWVLNTKHYYSKFIPRQQKLDIFLSCFESVSRIVNISDHLRLLLGHLDASETGQPLLVFCCSCSCIALSTLQIVYPF